ncbi:putative RNA-binding family protein [Melia azedarach]|uniref:RNA-binding family protein n=1 Tax=Melia azedarach TaxID=155640 RepID=A0ACC1YTH6_MELAZ|nr:putative RNA-binding family protein [Melia azedarach]
MFDMSQQRQNKMGTEEFGDTSYSKIFVGGLAWETQTDTMKNYFAQFGEILEAVIITDRITGKSKGYGFVTFKDPESARKACQINPFPVIDGRRANCNLAYLGAQKNRPTFSRHAGTDKIMPSAVTCTAPSDVHGKNMPQPFPQYPAYAPHMNYYGVQQQQYLPCYYNTRFPAGVYLNYYPFYASPSPSPSPSPTQYTKIVQSPYLSQQYGGLGIPSLPSPPSLAVTGGGKVPGITGDENSSNTQNT